MRASILVLTATLLSLPVQLPGQRMSCAYADAVARLDALSVDERELAVAKLHYCPDIRVAAITSLVRGGQSNAASDTLGTIAAWALFDPRLVDSVAAMARDARQPRERRVRFVGLLTRYADCGSAADISAMDRPEPNVLSSSFDTCDSEDRHDLPPADRDRARAAIAWVSQHDPDARLRAFAAQVSEELNEMWAAGGQTPSSRH